MTDFELFLLDDWWRGEGYDHCEDWTKEDVLNWFGDRGYIFVEYDDEENDIKFKIIKNFIFISEFVDSDWRVVLYELDSICCEPYTSWPYTDFSWERKDLINLLYKMKLIERIVKIESI